MKKIILASAVGIISILAATTFVSGQSASSIALSPSANNLAISSFVTKAGTAGVNAFAPNPKALKRFNKQFKADNVSWEQGINCAVANYTHDGIRERVYYNSLGQLVAIVKTYDENKMPADIRALIKSMYYDYRIIGVHQIVMYNKENDDPVYIISLEDQDRVIQATFHDGEINTYKEFGKG